jgi:TonB-dependent receptor
MFYGMYNNSRNDYSSQSKNYGVGGAGSVGYSFASNPDNRGEILQTSLSGTSKIKFLNIKADYGVAYSDGNSTTNNARSWAFTFNNASSSAITDIAHRKLTPSEIVPLFTDNPDKLLDCWLNGMNTSDSRIKDKNINAYLDFTVPFRFGSFINGNVKFGGLYRVKDRFRDDQAGSQATNANANQFSPKILADSLDWIVRNSSANISAEGFSGAKVENFLNGSFNYGNLFSIDRLNQISDKWSEVSDYYYALGPDVYLPIIGEIGKLGYTQNVPACMLNDQDITEKYTAAYIMPEINFGKYIMLLPGVRFENTDATMKGFYAIPPTYTPPITAPLTGSDTSATRSDRFLLPMIHLRIKPMKSFYMHFAYTQTLSRPDFNSISPNTYVNTGWAPFTYTSSNPALKPELWTNFDGQFTFHGSKVGLLSVTAFYKTVKDKIWNRTYKRIKGDPKISPFPDNATINVSVWENHPYKAYVQGLELEWQTSFYYLPKPFRFFTLNANYTYTQSQTTYPYTKIVNVTPPGGGRPVATRIDSTIVASMLYQPKNIANISLGFNLKGFNVWLSFQYNGLIYTGKNYFGVSRLDSQKDYFYRWDLQLTQKFAIRKLKGFEVVANIANISDFTESQRLTGDIRPTYQENYGMTVDLGLRFKF